MKTGSFLLALLVAAAPLATTAAQEPAPSPSAAQALDSAGRRAADVGSAESTHGTATTAAVHESSAHGGCEEYAPGDIITPHITDSHCLEVPSFSGGLTHEIVLPRWAPVHVGKYAVDLSPTKHVVMLGFAAFLCCLVLILGAQAHARHSHAIGRPKGFGAGIEAMVLYIRNEVAIPNLGGHGGYKYAPFILTLFFFILFANLLGLIPYGSTATGNISVTATLAIITFLVVEIAGMRAQGVGYLNTIFYWNRDLPMIMRVLMFFIMTPVEMVGKITKPFALAIRLFANMTAGHIVVLALIGLIFAFKSYVLGIAPALMAVAIMMLELFVAFLQAYIFALLASVFIGQIREAHH